MKKHMKTWSEAELKRVKEARRKQWKLAQMILNPMGSKTRLPKKPFGKVRDGRI